MFDELVPIVVVDFELFQTRKPTRPTARTRITATTSPINNPALLFDFCAPAVTCGGGGIAFATCGTVTPDGIDADSAIVAAGIGGGGFAGS